MCAVPGSCRVCVLSLSLMSTHNSHCSYLKWPEPHQQKKKRVKPRLPRCSLTLRYTLSGGEQPTGRHTVRVLQRKNSHKNQSFKLRDNMLKHNHLSSLVIFVICDKQHGRVLSFHRKWFSRTLPGHQSNCLKVFLVSKICHRYDWHKAASFKQNQRVMMWRDGTELWPNIFEFHRFFNSDYFNCKLICQIFKAFFDNSESRLIYI